MIYLVHLKDYRNKVLDLPGYLTRVRQIVLVPYFNSPKSIGTR